MKNCLKSVLNSLVQYSTEVKETRGRRIILKNSEADKSGGKYFNLLIPTQNNVSDIRLFRAFQAVGQFVPRTISKVSSGGKKSYDFTPIQATYNLVVKKSSQKITNRFLGQRLEPTLAVTIPVMIHN